MTVLGISANSRVVGIAVLNPAGLLDFNVHYHKEAWSDVKASRILGCLQRHQKRYPITHLAIAIPHAHYQNKETRTLIALIRSHCRKKGILLTPYQPEALHYLSQAAKAKKKTMMERLCELYPELVPLLKRERRNKRRYYFKLFEAVAVARLLCIELDCSNGKTP